MMEVLYTEFNGFVLWRVVLSIIVLFVFLLFTKRLEKFLFSFAKKTKTKTDDEILEKLDEPIGYLLKVIGFNIAISILKLHSNYSVLSKQIIQTLYIIGAGWILFILIDMFSTNIAKKIKVTKKIRSAMLNFVIKFLKTVVIIVAILTILSSWNYDISAFITSLGIGGLAFALAAKDTIANLFGSMVILWDKPFEYGDWIEAGEIEGTVAEIGLRSTQIRTFSNALVSIPNAKIANEVITNWSKREIGRRIKFHIGVTYNSKQEDIKNAIKEIKEMLINHPEIAKDIKEDTNALYSTKEKLGKKDTLIVNLDNFSASSIDILIYCFTYTTDWLKWLEIKEDVMFRIMNIIEKNHLEFAYPTQSLYIQDLCSPHA